MRQTSKFLPFFLFSTLMTGAARAEQTSTAIFFEKPFRQAALWNNSHNRDREMTKSLHDLTAHFHRSTDRMGYVARQIGTPDYSHHPKFHGELEREAEDLAQDFIYVLALQPNCFPSQLATFSQSEDQLRDAAVKQKAAQFMEIDKKAIIILAKWKLLNEIERIQANADSQSDLRQGWRETRNALAWACSDNMLEVINASLTVPSAMLGENVFPFANVPSMPKNFSERDWQVVCEVVNDRRSPLRDLLAMGRQSDNPLTSPAVWGIGLFFGYDVTFRDFLSPDPLKKSTILANPKLDHAVLGAKGPKKPSPNAIKTNVQKNIHPVPKQKAKGNIVKPHNAHQKTKHPLKHGPKP